MIYARLLQQIILIKLTVIQLKSKPTCHSRLLLLLTFLRYVMLYALILDLTDIGGYTEVRNLFVRPSYVQLK